NKDIANRSPRAAKAAAGNGRALPSARRGLEDGSSDMVHTLEKRPNAQTLIKIVLMLGLVLVGVAALAAEPEPAVADSTPAADCARTTFEFGGRVVQNGEATDSWTLTCWRAPVAEATMPSAGSMPM